MCIFHTQNKTKKVGRVLLNYIIYFNPVTLEFLKLLHEKCLGRAQSVKPRSRAALGLSPLSAGSLDSPPPFLQII